MTKAFVVLVVWVSGVGITSSFAAVSANKAPSSKPFQSVVSLVSYCKLIVEASPVPKGEAQPIEEFSLIVRPPAVELTTRHGACRFKILADRYKGWKFFQVRQTATCAQSFGSSAKIATFEPLLDPYSDPNEIRPTRKGHPPELKVRSDAGPNLWMEIPYASGTARLGYLCN